MITKYNKYCILCGTPSTETHHLVFGRANRKLSDADGLTIPLCRNCHKEIHNNYVAMALSKICGQLAYERWYLSDFGDADKSLNNARENFRSRYGKSFL